MPATDEVTLEYMCQGQYSWPVGRSPTMFEMERAFAWVPKQVEPVEVAPSLGAYFNSNGYGDWKYRHEKIVAQAQCLAKYLPAFMAEHNADFIAVRGTSGTFMAGALQALISVPVLLMRKRGEKSHGKDLEGDSMHTYKRGIILDDFVCTGSTVLGMMTDAAEYLIEFVAILEHYNAEATSPAPSRKQQDDGGVARVRDLNVYRFYA